MKQLSVWVLCGARAGDTAQAMELARRIGGNIHPIALDFNGRHMLPNWIGGISNRSLVSSSRQKIAPPWPDLVIATGKRTAPIAAWIRRQAEGLTIAVQLGRPRIDYHALDLIVTTPQYDLPQDNKVISVPLPFAAPKQLSPELLRYWSERWKALPRPWTAAVVGASKFPLRLGETQLDEFAVAVDAYARRTSGSLLLFDSPRSAENALNRLQSLVTVPHFSDDRAGPGNAYQAALSLADQFAVTGDSVSMVSEMLATGRPVHILPLPQWPAPKWSSDLPGAALLAREGYLSPTRSVHDFMTGLLKAGYVGNLRQGTSPRATLNASEAQEEVVIRIRRLLSQRIKTGGVSQD